MSTTIMPSVPSASPLTVTSAGSAAVAAIPAAGGPTTATSVGDAGSWVDVCAIGDVVADRGVAALVAGRQVAIFLLGDGRVFAIANLDPWSGTHVMSRGIVGSVGDRLVVSSPMYKQHVDLVTGHGVEDPAVTLESYPARVVGGRIEVAAT